MLIRIDLVGKRFGRLVVQSFAYTKERHNYWNCICDCGKNKITFTSQLTRGIAKSCGCLQKDIARKMTTKHNLTGHPLNNMRQNIKARCLNKNNSNYKYYGGRGIAICNEWENNAKAFYDWAINNGYKKGLQIDRINNDGNYCPENCRFVNTKIQSRNKSSNRILTHNGISKTVIEWAEYLKIPSTTILSRLNNLKWSIPRALTEPVNLKYSHHIKN